MTSVSVNEVKSQVLEEVASRETRRNNLVIFGIPEKMEGSIQERTAFDMDHLKGLLAELDCSGLRFKSVQRIGRSNARGPRLLRLRCENEGKKMSILRSAKYLRTSKSFPRVFINPDLTPLQQKEQKELRQDVRQRRAAGENVRIRHGKIVSSDDQDFH